MKFGVEHLTGYAAHVEHALEQLGDLHRGGAHEHRTSLLAQLDDLVDHCGIFLFLGLVDAVVHVDACHRTVRRDGHDVELVYIPQLSGLGLGRTGHAGKLVIHSEVVLQGDGGEGLRGSLNLHSLFGLYGLVESVGVAPALHDASGLFVDDLDLVVVDHIFHILLKEGVGFEQLCDGMYTLGLDGIVLHQLILFLLALCGVGDSLGLRELGGYVGEHEEVGVGRCAGKHVDTLVGKIHTAVFLVNDEI